MGFNVTCQPGRQAAAGVQQIGPDMLAVVMYFDPVNLAVYLPLAAGAGTRRELGRFLRELAVAAAESAARVDPDGEGRHCLAPAPTTRTSGSAVPQGDSAS
ncbi:hypothetical protein [Goodfellowiella coeruleoviolacea]|uniref:Uncharacterized protein n=1 Tax=Goodfellowiella coeruleoviolacea TaxID=334858 RepID=A0AAE3GII6_9PSEU|nr:hypothetical protein [Goodfellowiella coeruleoviolacea]MCP2168042.1 hypothetical protein [Goodfellowiella coeruleoviolacea]